MMKKNKKFEIAKEKIVGEIKEAAGAITGNEQLELSGKIQSAKADIKKKWNTKKDAGQVVEGIKEGIAGKINNMIDKKGKKKKK
jgi:uncharacterized protein YjbJ (UPF0337 family)